MRKIKKVMLLIVVFMIAVILKGNIAFAEYVIQVVPNVSAWTAITASDAYDACQKLNTTYSTLGTESLKAHLTTNADWYAVSLLTYSAYGYKSPDNTTGNNTGVMNLGRTFTSSLMEGITTNSNITSLYNNLGTSYVETVKNNTNRESNLPGRGLLASEYLTSSFGGICYGNDGAGYPVGCREKLFGFSLGYGGGWGYCSKGDARPDTTFRPVIWNK